MSGPSSRAPEFCHWDIAMVDIVGYSNLSEEGQFDAIRRLTEVVSKTEIIITTDPIDRIFLPTGDGMAIGFKGRPARPIELAKQIHKVYGHDRYMLKIGIHSGLAFEIRDINGKKNIAGSGINFAQRTLSCCRGGHILVAEDPGTKLKNTDQWGSALRDPYHFLVKHGVVLKAYNYCEGGVGNPSAEFNNLATIPSYEPLNARLRSLGITAKHNLEIGNRVTIDDVILEAALLGFQGVDPAHANISIVNYSQPLPDYVVQKKTSIPEPNSNRPKVYLAHLSLPLSDAGNRIHLQIGITDFWTCMAVEETIEILHADVESGKIELFKFPGQFICHVIVITADQKLVLCRRTEDVRYEKLAWSASFEESIDAQKDVNADGIIDPEMTVRRALRITEELGLPEEFVKSAMIKYLGLGREWSYLSSPLIVLVRLPSTSVAQLQDYFFGAHEGEHLELDTVDFTIPNCLKLLKVGRHVPSARPSAGDRLHSTSRLRILCAMFAVFGYGEVLSQLV